MLTCNKVKTHLEIKNKNMWTAMSGIIIGLPAEMGVFIICSNSLFLNMAAGHATYLVSFLLNFPVSPAVSMIVSGKNKKIDMFEALKSLNK